MLVFWLLSQPWTTTTVGWLGLKLELRMESALSISKVCELVGLRLK